MKTYHFLGLGALVFFTACGNNQGVFDASGVFETTEVIVSAQSSGEILQLDIEEGQELLPFNAIGYIDTMQLVLKRAQLMANRSATDSRVLNEAQQLSSLRQQLANLNRERSRFEDLVKADAATQKQLDDINYQIDVLEKQILSAKENINSANSSFINQSSGIDAQLAQIDDQIDNCIISSPIQGVVLSKYAEQGEYATPGRALFKVGNVKDMILRAYITADQLTTITLGQIVKVYADLGEKDSREYEGIVSWISNEAEFTPKTIQTRNERSNLVYAIKIAVKNEDGMIKRGMYGEMKIIDTQK